MKKTTAIVLAGLAIAASACGGNIRTAAPEGNTVETFVAATMAAVSQAAANAAGEDPSATPQAAETESAAPSEFEAGNVVTFEEMGIVVGYSYPQGFTQAASAGVSGVYEPNAPFELTYPARAHILFTPDTGADNMTASGMRVFRVEEINALQAGVVENLFAVLDGQADHHNDFPRLAGAGNVIDAGLVPLDFQNGIGYRFLLTKSFSADPLRSTNMTYMYQGVTDDEKYFLSFVVSVDAPFLAQYVDQPLTSAGEFETFYQNINNLIETADGDQFAPALHVLDELIASIFIVER
jgi:hypothetical protein